NEAGRLAFNWDSSELLTLESGGNVGIGTTTPTQKLDVAGAVRLGASGGGYDTLNTSAAAGAPSGDLYWGNRTVIDSSNISNFGVSSVTNSDGSITVSPTTGDVVSSLNVGHANDWTAQQTFAGNVGINSLTTSAALTFGADTVAAGGISFGGDTNLYRSAIGTLTTNGDVIISGGNVGIGATGELYLAAIDTLRTPDSLTVDGTFSIGTAAAGTTDDVLVLEGDGSVAKRAIDSRIWGSSLIDGSGTTNYLPKFSDLDTVTDSQLFDNGVNVGIGTALPSQKLDITGAVRLGAAGGANDVLNTSPTVGAPSGDLYWGSRTIIDSDNIQDFGVTSLTNSDGTLTISPTTGDVVASLNLGNANSWTGAQTFTTDTYFPGTSIWSSAGNIGLGTITTTSKLNFATGITAAAGINFGGDVTLYRSAADTLKTDDNFSTAGSINLGTAAIGTTNSVITREVGGDLTARSIDGRVWGSSLVDGSGTADYISYWSDANTLTSEQYLNVVRGGLGNNLTALGAGELLYSTGTTTYDSLAAGSASQLLIS
ncbi:MAG: hypothetical protein GW925_02895, partial [Candidatus Pacebacteria bacterium]|nr:hypothetical protein [Candidatus Paceibacterota bacterium]